MVNSHYSLCHSNGVSAALKWHLSQFTPIFICFKVFLYPLLYTPSPKGRKNVVAAAQYIHVSAYNQ